MPAKKRTEKPTAAPRVTVRAPGGRLAKSGKSAGNDSSGERGSFLCACGDIVQNCDRSSHECSARGPKSRAAAGRSAAVPSYSALAATISAKPAESSAEDVGDASKMVGRPIRRLKQAPAASAEMKRLRTLNWELKFSEHQELLIVLQRRNPETQEIETVACPIIEDPGLPIHEYRFDCDGQSYCFEWFM